MADEPERVGIKFWLQWLLATTVGWVGGLAALVLIPGTTSSVLVEGAVLAAAGSLVGALQWLVLRRRISRAGWWIPASAAGWCAGLGISWLYTAIAAWYLERTGALTGTLIGASMGAAIGILVGAGVGVLQWLILRRQVRRAVWWISASTVSWAGCLLIFALIPETTYSAFFGGVTLSGAVVGATTGLVLLVLLRPPSTFFISLRVRLLVIFCLLFAFLLAGAFFWFYNYTMNTALEERREEIAILLDTTSALIDGDDLVALYQEGKTRADGLTDDSRYWEQIHQMETMRGERPYALYTLIRADEPGKIVFIADTLALDGDPGATQFRETRSPSEDSPVWQGFASTTVHTGDTLSVSSILAEVLWHRPEETPTSTDPWHDERGAWISGYAPIRNARGDLVAALGIDLQDTYAATLRSGMLRAMIRGLEDLLGITLLIAFLLARSITRPIVAVTEAARRIGRGEYEQDLSHIREASFFHHEIDELADAIEESGRAHLSERRLRKQVEELKIEIDQVKRRRQVAEIVEDDFFQDLQAQARKMRDQHQND